MATVADPKIIFSEFGRTLGIPELALDENNAIRLSFDDIVIDAQYDAEKNHLVLLSILGELPATRDAEIYANLLEINLAGLLVGSGAVGLDRQESRLIYVDHLSFQGLTQEYFEEFIRRSVNVAEAWRNLINSPEFLNGGKKGGEASGGEAAVESFSPLRV